MFVDVHQHSTLSLQHWAEPSQNDKVENGKIVFFLILRGDRIHRI